MKKPLGIITDIEGTTTPKTFVFDVLFPYFLDHLSDLVQFKNHPTYEKAIKSIDVTLQEEQNTSIQAIDLIELLKKWVNEDRKHPALKELQGLIWEEGYTSQTLNGIVYPDVKDALNSWKHEAIQLAVYSSGSIKAQQLLFAHTKDGDLTCFFDNYFDTTTGHKREVDSYIKISEELGIDSKNLLFLSDIGEELDAAKETGMNTIQLIRDNTTVPFNHHPQVETFKKIKWS